MSSHWGSAVERDRHHDDVMRSTVGTAVSPRAFAPSIDLRANDHEVVFVCDVPGVKQDDLEVVLENHVLTIRGVRRFEGNGDEQVMLGRAYGSFSRSFNLPDFLDEARVSADLANGILTVRVAKLEAAKPRKIPIGAGSAAANQLER
jgi:HSP20 family protein